MNAGLFGGSLSALLALSTLGCDKGLTRGQSGPGALRDAAASGSSLPKRRASYIPDRYRWDWLRDGKRGVVSNDRRIIIDTKETRVVDGEPVPDLGRPEFLPEPLGGGVLFAGHKTIRYARTFDGKLETVAHCDGLLGSDETILGVGHSTVLYSGCDGSGTSLLSLPTGKQADQPLPGVTELLGTEGGLVAAIGEHGSLYVSSKAGAPWQRLLAHSAEGLDWYEDENEDGGKTEGKLLVRVRERHRVIGPKGKLLPFHEGATGHSVSRSWRALLPSSGQKEPKPEYLRDLYARLMAPGRAVVIERPDLLFFDGWTGRVESTLRGVIPTSYCYFKRGGTPSLIGCPGARPERTDVLRIDAWGSPPVKVEEIPVATHRLQATATGHALVFPGRCDGALRRGHFCVLQRDTSWKQYSLSPKLLRSIIDVSPVELALALPNGVRVVGLARGSDDEWVLMDAARGLVRRLKEKAIPEWPERSDCVTLDENSLRFVIAGNRGLYPNKPKQARILEVRFDGRVTTTPLDGKVSCIGARALQLLPDGTLRESLDAGRSFHAVAPPPGGASELKGCQDTGCEVDSWYRVGWGVD